MLLNKVLKSIGNGFRKAFQDFDTENMADELDKASLAVFVNLAQQILGDMRMLGMQQFSEIVRLVWRNVFAVFDFAEYGVVFG